MATPKGSSWKSNNIKQSKEQKANRFHVIQYKWIGDVFLLIFLTGDEVYVVWKNTKGPLVFQSITTIHVQETIGVNCIVMCVLDGADIL